MNIIYKDVSELIPYVNNPRKNEKAVDGVASSIKNFGFKNPIIIDGNNEIVAGHTRLKAAKKLGITSVPCIIADDLTPSQIKAFRIADNRVSEASEWDMELLKIELDGLEDFTGFDIEDFAEDNPYTKKIQTPIYEPKLKNPPDITELFDDMKTSELIKNIEESDISEAEKNFLILAAQRHNVFKYNLIAEYYAHSSDDIKRLMEESALVIIDYNKAIEYGFTRLNETILELVNDDE
jgi:hypothetical protein